MTILAWVVLGLISGFIARTVANAGGGSVRLDTALGVAGAIVGGLIFTAVGAAGVTGFDLWSLFVATGGAASALAAYHALSRRRRLA
jgi:uncharacterized membrane protein YeaQ/YmgE (transglycosylase-associated protein family)